MLALLTLLAPAALAGQGPDSPACAGAVREAAEGRAVADAALAGLDAACLDLVALAPKVRHGYKLRDEAPRAFFTAQGLYAPTPSFNEALLQPVDHDNVQRATRAAEDMAVREAVAAARLFSLGTACEAPPTGPVTALCLDGRRGTARVNSAQVEQGPEGPVWTYDVTLIHGGVDPTAPGCLVIEGQHGARPASAQPGAAATSLQATCKGRGASCQASAGDLDGDGRLEGLVQVKGEGAPNALSTELWVQEGGAWARTKTLCTFGG